MPHPEHEHALQIALATALRERDEARAMAEKWIMREAACVERGIRADADALSEIQGLQAALAAARRECETLRTALRGLLDSAGFDWNGGAEVDAAVESAVEKARTALVALGDGEEGKR